MMICPIKLKLKVRDKSGINRARLQYGREILSEAEFVSVGTEAGRAGGRGRGRRAAGRRPVLTNSLRY